VITRHFQDMVEHYCGHWARRMIAQHLHLKCGQTKVTNIKEPQCVQKSTQSHKESYNKSLGLPRLFKSL
jgi:hypothetical protein